MEETPLYNIIRSGKRKTVSIVIRTNNTIEVLAPSRAPTIVIDQFVRSKSAWIKRKLHFNREIRSNYKAKQFVAGELFQLLGTSLTLVIKSGKRSVVHSDNELIVSLPTTLSPEKREATIKNMVQIWYRDQADIYLAQRCEELGKRVGKIALLVATKSYKSRWGSCHQDGRIYFNWRLMMAPVWVVDYVIVHELCHLAHHNHSREYWSLVESIMPDYRHAKTWLKINGDTLAL